MLSAPFAMQDSKGTLQSSQMDIHDSRSIPFMNLYLYILSAFCPSNVSHPVCAEPDTCLHHLKDLVPVDADLPAGDALQGE